MSAQIVIKKMSKLVGTCDSSLSFGAARSQMARDLLKSLTIVIERKADHPRPYYILVHAGPDHGARGGHVIKERIILLDQLPATKMIGTLAFRIDNKHGDAELVWALPLDIPGLPFEGEASKNTQVIVDSKGLPIINRTIY
jgi:hypothetical protein